MLAQCIEDFLQDLAALALRIAEVRLLRVSPRNVFGNLPLIALVRSLALNLLVQSQTLLVVNLLVGPILDVDEPLLRVPTQQELAFELLWLAIAVR